LLLAVFRGLVDDLHRDLAGKGHPDARPLHGFVLQAVGHGANTATTLAKRLGVSKQAAGKTIQRLEVLGYLERRDGSRDARQRRVVITAKGIELLALSALGFDRARQHWRDRLGAERLAALEDDLARLAPEGLLQLDLPGWLAAESASMSE